MNGSNTGNELQKLYGARFSEIERKRNSAIWFEICKYLQKFLSKKLNLLVDVAAGNCDFINNINCGCTKIAFDLNPDVIKKFDGGGVFLKP